MSKIKFIITIFFIFICSVCFSGCATSRFQQDEQCTRDNIKFISQLEERLSVLDSRIEECAGRSENITDEIDIITEQFRCYTEFVYDLRREVEYYRNGANEKGKAAE